MIVLLGCTGGKEDQGEKRVARRRLLIGIGEDSERKYKSRRAGQPAWKGRWTWLRVCCHCYYKATRALVGGIEAEARLLGLKIEGDKIRSKCYIECHGQKKTNAGDS